MARAAIADYPPGARMPPRVIDDYEFVWMLRGTARLLDEDGPVPLSPGQLLLVPPGVRHGFEWDPAAPARHGYVHFPAEPAALGRPARAQVRRMTGQDPLAGLCAYLLWLGRGESNGWEQQTTATLWFLLDAFLAGPLPDDDGTATALDLSGPLLAAVAYLRERWSQPPLRRVAVAELAAAAHVSRSYLNRTFRSGFGLSAGAAMERARCARAETLLGRTDLTAETVARQCGFADMYHFSHRFARIYGMPPSVYRRQAAALSVRDHPGVRRLVRALWE